MRPRARPSRSLALVALAAAGAVATAACARNPVTGKRQLTLVSEEQEIQLGQQSAKEVVQQMPVVKDDKLQAYVSQLGKRIAAKTERPNVPWSFTVLDDSTVNAFALPGGPIFITRGILTHMNSEAELVSVLGHEIGHVTARHSVQQMSKAQVAQLGLGIGSILSPEVAQLGSAAAAGLQLLFLKYGRDDERQADQLGFKYMVAQQYDPRQQAEMFDILERVSGREGGGRMPEWQSTHPDPGARADTARKRSAKVPNLDALKVDRDGYLAHLGGLVFGDDPRQGYFKGTTFYHPDLRFQIQFPEGWKTANSAGAVIAASPKQDAVVQLTTAGQVSPKEATTKFFQQEGVKPGKAEAGTVGGLPATASYFEAQTQQGAVAGIVSFVSHGGVTFQIVGYTPAQGLAGYDAAFKKTINTFADLTDPAALNVQPARVELVKVPRTMTLEEFNRQFPSSIPLEQLAIVNGVPRNGTLQAGTTVKRIVGGPQAR